MSSWPAAWAATSPEVTARNDFHEIIAGILVMAVYVTGLNALLWRRLYSIAESKYALA